MLENQSMQASTHSCVPGSYRSPKTMVRASSVEGRGLYAVDAIARDEIVAIKGGHIIDEETFQRSKEVIGNSDIKIADGFHLTALSPDEYEGVMMFLNHSCDPNVGVQGNTVFVAMRGIQAGEELSLDYAMIDDCDERLECRCGVAACRGVVTGKDWQRKELQARYGCYFSAYLLRKMEDADS
jgi:SET domain-containing protein